MRFHVLGLGPVGTLLSYYLRRTVPNVHPITLIHRTTQMAKEAALKGGSVSVENSGVVSVASGFKTEASYSMSSVTPSGGGPIESLFVTTKAHQTLDALYRLSHRISRNSTIVLLQNGMGVYEELVERVFRNSDQRPHFILATNNHGAFLKNPGLVVHTGIGSIEFAIVPDPQGPDYEAGFHDENVDKSERRLRSTDILSQNDSRYNSVYNTVEAMLSMDALNISWKPMSNIQLAMRRKLVVNAVINPLTALMGCRNGDIFKADNSLPITKRICQEAASVFAKEMQAETDTWIADLTAQGTDTNDVELARFPRSLTSTSLQEEVLRVARITGGNISSMLTDIRRGSNTEIDYLNGYLLKLGSTYRVPMPGNAMLLNLVKLRSNIPLDQML